MKSRTLAILIRIILAGFALCGIGIYIFILPSIGQSFVDHAPEFSYAYVPWMIFLLITLIPCYIVVVLGFMIASRIAKEDAFSFANSKLLKGVAICAAADSAFFLLGNIVLLFVNMNHPGIVLLSLLIVFIGASIAVASYVLSELTANAAAIRDENALTI